MKQAVKDLREMYGRELGSDDTDDEGEKKRPKKVNPFGDGADDDDSEGITELEGISKTFKGSMSSGQAKKFKAYEPMAGNTKPQEATSTTTKYDPRDYIDQDAR